MATAITTELTIEPVTQKCIFVLRGFENYAAAGSAVTARRAAPWHVFFPAESDAAVAAVSRFDVNLGFVDEQVGLSLKIYASAAAVCTVLCSVPGLRQMPGLAEKTNGDPSTAKVATINSGSIAG